MHNPFFILFLGLLLGIKHAFEPDHLIAVSTLVTQLKKPLKSALVGAFWGMGHTLTLFVVSLIVLFLKLKIPELWSRRFETGVGVMLIILGLRAIKKVRKQVLHLHVHNHIDFKHQHLHIHDTLKDSHQHKQSFLIGAFHGLAGSGTLMLLIFTTIKSTALGLYYVLIFGIGSILGMTGMSLFLSLPLVILKKKFLQIDKYLQIGAGTLSIVYGVFLIIILS